MQHVYAVWDPVDSILYQFVGLDTTTPQQAVSSFIEAHGPALFGSDLTYKEACLNDVNKTTSLEELTEVLRDSWSLTLNSIQVN